VGHHWDLTSKVLEGILEGVGILLSMAGYPKIYWWGLMHGYVSLLRLFVCITMIDFIDSCNFMTCSVKLLRHETLIVVMS